MQHSGEIFPFAQLLQSCLSVACYVYGLDIVSYIDTWAMNILSILVFDGPPPKQPFADHQRGQEGGWVILILIRINREELKNPFWRKSTIFLMTRFCCRSLFVLFSKLHKIIGLIFEEIRSLYYSCILSKISPFLLVLWSKIS